MYQMDYPSGVATYTNQFTYLAPTISSVAPSSGPTTGGRKVTIKGTDLQGAAVTIGGTAAAGVTVNRAGRRCGRRCRSDPPDRRRSR